MYNENKNEKESQSTDAEAEERFGGLIDKYHRLARLAGTRQENYQHSTLIYIIHVILTGRRAPHAKLLTVPEQSTYLQEALGLEAQDAATLMDLYTEAVRQRPDAFPHIRHLLERARKPLAAAGEEAWLYTPPASAKTH